MTTNDRDLQTSTTCRELPAKTSPLVLPLLIVLVAVAAWWLGDHDILLVADFDLPRPAELFHSLLGRYAAPGL